MNPRYSSRQMPNWEGLFEPDGVQTALFFETPEEIYARVFRELRPRTLAPQLRVEFCKFANPDSFARLENGKLHVRISDLLAGAPAPVMEALAQILLRKLCRKPVPKAYSHRYRLYLNRSDVRRQTHLIKQIRGRKFLSGPKGVHYDLTPIFDALNGRYFDGLLGRPDLSWSRTAARRILGHFDASHNAIIISKIFDRPEMSLPLEYVMFHEMLHLRYPVEHGGARRRVHTKDFKQAEKKFPQLKEAKERIKRLG
jgi:hypothetical protein